MFLKHVLYKSIKTYLVIQKFDINILSKTSDCKIAIY